MEYAGYIVIEDHTALASSSGNSGRRFFKPVTDFMLEAGQRVVRLDDDTFLLPESGEKFQRVK